MEFLNFNRFLKESAKTPKDAAGIVILYQNMILLTHPTNASWKKGTCGIPKGGIELGEDPLEAAIRELYEETGIMVTLEQLDPSPETIALHEKNRTRSLTYFICRIEDLSEIGLTDLKVPKSKLQLDEIDWAKFVGPEEAYPITLPQQLIILDRHLSLR